MYDQTIWIHALEFILFLGSVSKIAAEEQWHVSDKLSTWTEAGKSCYLATPRIDYDALSIDIPLEMVKEQMWVGYYLEPMAFEYIGCMSTRSYHPNVSFNNMSPGRCKAACELREARYIGISKTACFCIQEPKGNTRRPQCNESCGTNICGGEGYMSIYKETTVREKIVPSSGMCLAFDIHNRQFKWRRCRDEIKTICRFGNSSVKLLNDGNRTWSSSIEECLRNDCDATSYNTSLHASQGTGPVWTRIAAGVVVRKINASESIDLDSGSTGITYGFVSNDSTGHVRLRFGSSTQTLRALCRGVREKASGTSNRLEHGKSVVVIGVGVSVPVALLIIGVVVGCFIFRRRERISKQSRVRLTTDEAGCTNIDDALSGKVTTPAFINEAFDQYCETDVQIPDGGGRQMQQNSSDGNDHKYFVLEKQPDKYDQIKQQVKPHIGLHPQADSCTDAYTYFEIDNLKEKTVSKDTEKQQDGDDLYKQEYSTCDAHPYLVLEKLSEQDTDNVVENEKASHRQEIVNTGNSMPYDTTVRKSNQKRFDSHGTVEIDETEDVHAYGVLELSSKGFVDTDTTYNVLSTGQCKSEPGEISVYNVLKVDDNATYDNAFTTRPRQAKTSIDTYDTIATIKAEFNSGDYPYRNEK